MLIAAFFLVIHSWGYLTRIELVMLAILGLFIYKSSYFKLTLSFLFYFLRRFVSFWWTKIKIYNYRYYFFSLNVVMTESDLFWLQVHRDVLYPNDDRYFRIYRRWVFWMSPELLEEDNDYFNLYLLGYFARSFILSLRLAFIYGRIYVQNLIIDLLGATLGHIIFFGVYCSFFLVVGKITGLIHRYLWLTYVFLLRQFQYWGSNYINFHILEELNMSWTATEIPGNFDAFDEITYGYAKDPSPFLVRLFVYFKRWEQLGEQNGLDFLGLASTFFFYGKYFFSFVWAMPFIIICNLIYYLLTYVFLTYENSLFFYRFILNHMMRSKIALLESMRSTYSFGIFIKYGGYILYYILLLPLALLRNIRGLNLINVFFYLMSSLYYNLVMTISFLSYLPALVFYGIRFLLRMLVYCRWIILLFLVVILFSDHQLYFIYIFSFGWLVNIVLTHLDSLHLFRPEEFIEIRLSYRYVASSMPTYPIEFFKTLYYYQIYVWRKISDVYRVRSAWDTMTKKWTVWIFFMRFMPFYGQTSMIQKWWFNAVYYFLLRTPLLFWWTYATYDPFYGTMWGFAAVLKIFIFIPYSFLKGFAYWIGSGSRILRTTGSYLSWFIFGFLKLIRDYLIKPFLRSLIYLIKWSAIILWQIVYVFLQVVIKISGFMFQGFFKASFYYILAVHFSFDDSFYWASYYWLISVIYGDVFYYLSFFKVHWFFFLKLSFILDLIETYREERLVEFFGGFREYLWAWTNTYGTYLQELREKGVLVNPLFFFLASMLEAQKYLDILSVNWQFPRDVQRNVIDFLYKKDINYRFLRWILPLRRTEMYSTARWYMPIMTYFSLINFISYYGDGNQDAIGFDTLMQIRQWIPSYFYGFIWNTIFLYYGFLIFMILFFPSFCHLIINQGATDDHINREYNWYRFTNQTAKELNWLFPHLYEAEKFIGHTDYTNALETKIIYYKKLLARTLDFKPVGSAIAGLIDDCFIDCDIGEDDFNFVIPEFLDFYLNRPYPSFRTALNKGDDRFLYFTALAYSRDEWIKTLWERTEDDDYNNIGEEVLIDQANLDHYISFFDKLHDIQRKTDAYLFNNELASWTFAKDPYSFSIIRTSTREDFMEDRWAQYFSKLSDEYEYEDDSDITYFSWSLWGWFLVIPYILFYKAFFFLGGSHWHNNRFSSGIIHPFMLYLHAVLLHFESLKLVAEIAGDTYPNVKREASFIGNHQMMQYRPVGLYGELRASFYDYKLPLDSYGGQTHEWSFFRILYFRWESLNLSALECLHFINIFSFLIIFLGLPLIIARRSNLAHWADFFSINNQELLHKWFNLKTNWKKVYLWFWR
jgi:hypothetical protein